MILVNFSHPITETQHLQIERLADIRLERIVQVKTQLDESEAFMPQVMALVDVAPLSDDDWQGLPIIVNLPSLNNIAALVLAELHGRAGHFPSILRLRPVLGSPAREFEVAEIVNLQDTLSNHLHIPLRREILRVSSSFAGGRSSAPNRTSLMSRSMFQSAQPVQSFRESPIGGDDRCALPRSWKGAEVSCGPATRS